MKSMTGFARIDGSRDGVTWYWEARSVNGKGLDLRARLPDAAERLDQPLRQAMKAAFVRGNVTVSLRYSRTTEGGDGLVNRAALDRVLAAIAEVEAAAQAAGAPLKSPDATAILSMRGVMDGETADYGWIDEAGRDVPALVAALDHARQEEGAHLARVLGDALDTVEGLVRDASDSAAVRAARTGETLRARVAELIGGDVDPARLEQELALIAVKADVTEELDRLAAHVAAARGLIAKDGPVGRKFDFLMQEFNREANTLAAKSGDAALTAIALDMKVVIDQMREQVQNVE